MGFVVRLVTKWHVRCLNHIRKTVREKTIYVLLLQRAEIFRASLLVSYML